MTTIEPRPGSDVMQPATLAAMQPSALSVSRRLIDRMVRERWQIALSRIDVAPGGAGTVIYTVDTPAQTFSFIAFTFEPAMEGRTGRIIGRSWDMMCALIEGPATEAEVETARRELPRLYKGRATPGTLIWGRSNRSMRVFDTVLAALMAGQQPAVEAISDVCYLMRNTGLDGNGTFGTRPYATLGQGHALGGMLEAQMLCAYLMRELSCDLVSHIARMRAPDTAVPLALPIREYLGVGNGSALGLIFYVQKHARLIDSWLGTRERAIAAARALPAEEVDREALSALLDRAIGFRLEDRMVYEAFASSAEVARDLAAIVGALPGAFMTPLPLDHLYRTFHGSLCPEAFETLLSMMIEQIAERDIDLSANISGEDGYEVQAADTVSDLLDLVERDYDWALVIDMKAPGAKDYIWYKSETAEEPRRGRRAEVPDARDLGMDLPGDVQLLRDDLQASPPDQRIARFLLAHPEHRFTVARVQSLAGRHYHTPRANIHSADFVPIDLVRLMNVAIHGIDKTRDFLKRNLRGILFHGAPSRRRIAAGDGRDWFYPAEPRP